MSQEESKEANVRRGKPSASAFDYLIKCPGRQKNQGGRKSQSSAISNAGTRMHQYALDPNSIELVQEEKDFAERMVNELNVLLRRVWGGWQAQYQAAHDNGDWLKFRNEKRMWYRNNRYSGVPDVLAIKDGIGYIADYKTGPKRVPHAKDNLQLMALAVLAEYNHKLKGVHVAVIQPICGPPHTHFYDSNGLKNARRKITRILRAVEAENPKLKAGVSQCRYCLAKPDCPAVKKAEEGIMALSSISTLTPPQISKALTILPVVEARCKAIREEVFNRLENSANSVPGYALKPSAHRRKLVNPVKVFNTLVGGGLIDEEGLMGATTISFNRLVKAVQEYRSVDKFEAQFAVEDALDGLLQHTAVKAKVVER